jgi:hypothetical protein
MKTVNEFHKRSHLIPEWMYTECYDEKHKIFELSSVKVVKKQKGIYCSFMCNECEGESQKYDRYASLILTDRSPTSDEYKSIKKHSVIDYLTGGKVIAAKWENIDFKKFQKFVFSVILRTHFAGKFNGNIALSKKHLDAILSIYKNEDGLSLDDSSYPILICEYRKNDILKNHVILPCIGKREGHHIIEFSGGGYLFNVYVSSHSKPKCIKSLHLKRNGSIYLLKTFFNETGLYNTSIRVAKALENSQKLTQ